MNKYYGTSLVVLAMAASTPAFAEGAAASDSGALGEIIVTANRRAENLQTVPIAVTAIAQDELKARGVFDTSDLSSITPNLQVNSAYGKQQPNFSLRGIGVGTEYNANAASPVGVNVDEVYQTFRASHGQQLYDLDQIEVLRGPQGTLYGRNTTGGAINFITRKPKLQGQNGYGTVGYGNYNAVSLEGAFEATPIEDKLGIRIAGTYSNTDSYIENKLPAGINRTNVFGPAFGNLNTGRDPGGPESWGVRLNMLYEPTDALSVGLKLYTAQSEGGVEVGFNTGRSLTNDTVDLRNSPLGALYATPLAPLLPAPYSRSAAGMGDDKVEADSVGEARTSADGAVLNVSYALNDAWKIINIVGYDQGEYIQTQTDCDGTPYRVCSIGYDNEFEAWNEDFRLQYSGEKLQATLGAYYGWDQIRAANTPDFFNFLSDVNLAAGNPSTYFNPFGLLNPLALPTGVRGLNEFEQTRKSAAIYGEAKYEVVKDLNVTLGLRYTDDEFSYSKALTTFFDDAGNPRMYSVNSQVTPFVVGLSPGAVVPLDVSNSSSKLTGRGIVDWTPVEDLMFYASYSRGYRGGTYNGLAYFSAAQVYFVKPETVDAFEVGMKGRFLDETLQVNLSAFHYDYKNQQGQVVDSQATTYLVSLDGQMQGFEAELQYAATKDLKLSAAVGYLDSEYDHGACPAAPIASFPLQVGNCLGSPVGNIDVGGNPFPYAAEWSVTLGVDWNALQIGTGAVKVHGDAAYTGEFFYDSFGDYTYQGAAGGLAGGPVDSATLGQGRIREGGGDYWVVNGRVSYDTPNYTLSVWGKNLTDETYYPFAINVEPAFGSSYAVRSAPLTFGVELSARF